MMMHCLQLGGLELCYDADNERVVSKLFPNNQNKYYYEYDISALDESVRGKCVKYMGDGILDKGLRPLKVVYMKRNPLSQYRSSKHSLGRVQPGYEDHVRTQIDRLSKAEQVGLTVLDYDQVIDDPLKAFVSLYDDGWPIDPVKASLGVDRSMKHF